MATRDDGCAVLSLALVMAISLSISSSRPFSKDDNPLVGLVNMSFSQPASK